jgi:hypothetical protein
MKNTTLFLLIILAAFSRLIPHIPNVTAITAMALLGGALFSNRLLALLAPLMALLISDLVLGFHSTLFFVYGAVALIAILASFGLKTNSSVTRLGAASLASTFLFFVITNFGFWMMESLYPKTAEGLVQAYVMALPFLGTQVVGDLFYTGLLFGAFELIRRLSPSWVAESV